MCQHTCVISLLGRERQENSGLAGQQRSRTGVFWAPWENLLQKWWGTSLDVNFHTHKERGNHHIFFWSKQKHTSISIRYQTKEWNVFQHSRRNIIRRQKASTWLESWRIQAKPHLAPGRKSESAGSCSYTHYWLEEHCGTRSSSQNALLYTLALASPNILHSLRHSSWLLLKSLCWLCMFTREG